LRTILGADSSILRPDAEFHLNQPTEGSQGSSETGEHFSQTPMVLKLKSVHTIGLVHGACVEAAEDVEKMRAHVEQTLATWPSQCEEDKIFGAVKQVLTQALVMGAPAAVLLDGNFSVIMLLRGGGSIQSDTINRPWRTYFHVAHCTDSFTSNGRPSVLQCVDIALQVRCPSL
jgi:hypothetical protein